VVSVTGGRRTSPPGAAWLEIVNRSGARTVTVTVKPAPGGALPRPTFPACRLDPPPPAGPAGAG
jgi:hypothetical protein